MRRITAALLSLAAVAATLTLAGARAAGEKPPAPRPYQPGDVVWTASPPSSDGALVTPEPAAPLPGPEPRPVRPYQPGDLVWSETPPAQLAASVPDATGCQRVPASGYIGKGVFTQTTFEYANYWSWSDASSYQSFTWYVKKTDGTTQAYATSSGGGGAWNGGANIYQRKVQNHGSTPQAWTVCYDVR